MGNWENLYYEIHEEVTTRGVKKQFYQLVRQLAETDQFRNKGARAQWNEALSMIRKNEY